MLLYIATLNTSNLFQLDLDDDFLLDLRCRPEGKHEYNVDQPALLNKDFFIIALVNVNVFVDCLDI